jgi:hypothetical protein
MLEVYNSMNGQMWLTEAVPAGFALTTWEIGVTSVATLAIDRWRAHQRDAALWAALAHAPVALARCDAAAVSGESSGDAEAGTSQDGVSGSPAAVGGAPVAKGGETEGQGREGLLSLPALVAAADALEARCWVEAGMGEYGSMVSTRMAEMVSRTEEVVWMSLEPKAGTQLDFYDAPHAETLEVAFQSLVAADAAEGRPQNVPLGPSFVVPGAVVTMFRNDPGSFHAATHVDEACPTYHMFQSTPTGGHRSVLRYQVAREEQDGAGEVAGVHPVFLDVEAEVRTSSVNEWRFAETTRVQSPSSSPGGSEDMRALEPANRTVRAPVPPQAVIFSIPHIEPPQSLY